MGSPWGQAWGLAWWGYAWAAAEPEPSQTDAGILWWWQSRGELPPLIGVISIMQPAQRINGEAAIVTPPALAKADDEAFIWLLVAA